MVFTWLTSASTSCCPCVGLRARTHAHKGKVLGLQLQRSAAKVGSGASLAVSPNSSAGGFSGRAEVPFEVGTCTGRVASKLASGFRARAPNFVINFANITGVEKL